MLEGERQLGGRALERARSARASSDSQYEADEAADPLELLVGDGRVAGADELVEIVRHGRRAQVDPLEQRVHRVADLGRGEAGLPGNRPGGGSLAAGRPPARRSTGTSSARTARARCTRAGARGAAAARAPRRAARARGASGAAAPFSSASNSSSCSSVAGSGADLGLAARTGRAGRSTRAPPRSISSGAGRGLLELARLEPVEHPADRRAASAPRSADRARDDQPVDRARHGDVVEPPPLGLLRVLLGRLDALVLDRRQPLAGLRVGDAEAEPPVRQAEDLVRVGPPAVAARVGDDDDLELEPLGRVDRQQPDHVGALLLGDRLELGRADRVLLGDEAHEALRRRARAAPRTSAPSARACAGSRSGGGRPTGRARRGRSRARRRSARRAARATATAPGAASRSKRCLKAWKSRASLSETPSGIPFSSPTKSGRFGAARRSRTSPSFETPTNGEASTPSSASSS